MNWSKGRSGWTGTSISFLLMALLWAAVGSIRYLFFEYRPTSKSLGLEVAAFWVIFVLCEYTERK
jgi:hypothetical protein